MDDSRADEVTVARRFHGPPGSGNGGYTAGLLAALYAGDHTGDLTDERTGAVEVTLRRPPPLDTPLRVRRPAGTPQPPDDAATLALLLDEQVVAEARRGRLSADPVDAVSLADARDAEQSYAGLTDHPFPTCFTCGPDRDDGLGLSPGRLPDGRTACTWTPDTSLAAADEPTHVRPEFVWAALDCPGGWTADIVGRPMVLGRITAEVYAPAEVGERHVVMGRWLGEDGRKTFTTTTLYDSDGRALARAEQVWFAVDPATFG
jgi:hypothetical protein